tara:strand:+ start:1719 stop:2447 length:729 start_codon:yes stop_codon:yes gene_type:complete
MSCPVCFEPLESAFVAECGHPLCRICKDRIDATCPICRQPDLNFHPLYLPDREERKEEEGDPGLTPSDKLEKVKDERDRAVATMTESMEVAKMIRNDLVTVKAERDTLDRNLRELNADYLSIHSMLATVRAERDAAERNLRELNADNLSLHSMPPHIPHGADQRHYFSICRCGKLKAVNSFASAHEGKMQYFSVCRSCKERKESRRNCGSSDDGSSGSSSKCPCGRSKRSFHRLCKSCHQGY